MHVYLVSLLNHAMKFYDLNQNVASLVGNFEIESQKRLNYWTLDQFNQFYEALATQQQSYSLNYCSTLGRKGEIRALTWCDINYDDEFIHINKTDYHGEVTALKRNQPYVIYTYLLT